MSLVSTEFRLLITSPAFIEMLVERDLFISRTYHLSYVTQCRLLKSVHEAKSKALDFLGFATNGGIDEDNPVFWLRKVFINSNHSYCTRENQTNVNVAGVLRVTQTSMKSSEELFAETKERILLASARLGRAGRNLVELTENKRRLRKYGPDLIEEIASVSPNLLKKEEETIEDCVKSVREVTTGLSSRAENSQKLRRYPLNPCVLEEPVQKSVFPTCGKLACIKTLDISRDGAFTCPVLNLLVFSSLVYVDVENPVFELYNNLTSLREIQALVESNPAIPPINNVEVSEDYQWCEFRGKAWSTLQPIVWVGFQSSETRCTEVLLNLQQRFMGIYLYVKLINPENRRVEQHWEHEFMNIDIKHVVAKGQVFDCGE